MFIRVMLAICAAGILCAPHPTRADSEEIDPKTIGFDFTGYPAPGPTQLYKGHYLVGSAHPDVKNRSFFETAKIAINLLDRLDEKIVKDTRLIKVIIYNPPSKHKKEEGAHTNITGVYTYGPNLFQGAPLVIHRNTKYIAPVNITYSLAGSSVMAREQRTLIRLHKKLADGPNGDPKSYQRDLALYEEIWASIKKTDQAIVDKYACGPALAEFAARKVLERDPLRRDAFARDLSRRNCL